MRVSIIVLNYNYARFVAQAIDCALRQTWKDCEVIVVDNGSTDNSLSLIEPYGQRVRVVRQPCNIGQGHGYNLGIAAATGEWLMWLDADDLIDDDAIEKCMVKVDEHTSKVQFAMRLIDAEGHALGGQVPYLSHQGDVRAIIEAFGHYAGPPGSGNVYRRSAVERFFPVPPEDWPICTDTVPFLTAPFFGPVVHLAEQLGGYRQHRRAADQPLGYRGNYAGKIAAEVQLNDTARRRTLALLRDRGGIDVAGPFLPMPAHVRHRILSWRMNRAQHPFAADTVASLWKLMWLSSGRCPGYTLGDRLLLRAWAALALCLPHVLADRWLFGRRDASILDTAARPLPGKAEPRRHS